MSSLRNAVKRVTHKERSQPQARSHLGLLEKKKDYRIRARDYHEKQDAIQSMRRKASFRNPDEFYFGMHNSEVREDGRHHRTQKVANLANDTDLVKIMKSQDLNYVRMMRQIAQKNVLKARSSLHLIDSSTVADKAVVKKPNHTIFVANEEEAQNFDVARHFDSVPELAKRSFNRLRKSAILKNDNTSEHGDKGDGSDDDEEEKEENGIQSLKKKKKLWKQVALAKRAQKTVARARSASYGEWMVQKQRMELLENAEAHLITEKIATAKGKKRKVKEAEHGKPAIYKFARRRAN